MQLLCQPGKPTGKDSTKKCPYYLKNKSLCDQMSSLTDISCVLERKTITTRINPSILILRHGVNTQYMTSLNAIFASLWIHLFYIPLSLYLTSCHRLCTCTCTYNSPQLEITEFPASTRADMLLMLSMALCPIYKAYKHVNLLSTTKFCLAKLGYQPKYYTVSVRSTHSFMFIIEIC